MTWCIIKRHREYVLWEAKTGGDGCGWVGLREAGLDLGPKG